MIQLQAKSSKNKFNRPPIIFFLVFTIDWGFESRLEYKNLNEMTKRITSTSEMKTTKVATSKNFSMWLDDTKLENK